MSDLLEKSEDILNLVEAELDQISNLELKQALVEFLVIPYQQIRTWDYSRTNENFPCWIVASFNENDLALASSQFGHGARGDHWGIVHISEKYFGRDDSWFLFLEDAFINSGRYRGYVPEDYEIR